MTPAGRIAAAIDLLAAIETTRARPADAVANDYFRARRFIGGGDRRAVAEQVWRVLRTRRRLGWWLRAEPHHARAAAVPLPAAAASPALPAAVSPTVATAVPTLPVAASPAPAATASPVLSATASPAMSATESLALPAAASPAPAAASSTLPIAALPAPAATASPAMSATASPAPPAAAVPPALLAAATSALIVAAASAPTAAASGPPPPTASPRLLVAASLLLEGGALGGVASAFSGGRFAAAPLTTGELATLRRLEGHSLEHRGMPDAVRLELPDWLLPRLAERFGAATETELQALLQPAPLDLRVNLLKTTRDAAQSALAAEGFAAVPTRISPWGLRIADRRPVTSGAAFQSGLVEIQDEGSQLVAMLVGARPGQRVCDFCAGAGGKTLALAMTMDNRGQLVACDTSPARLENAVRRLRRAGISNVERHLLEPGDKWTKRRARSFDRVLIDAPCTGTGTWRRNPDARQRLTEADIATLITRQAAILDAAAPLVRKHGRLVYATCALLEEENESQVMQFLARHPGFALVPLTRAWPFDSAPPGGGDFLALTPARHGTDGFFAAVLEQTT